MSVIGIIGTRWVGSSVAISALHMGVAQQLILHASLLRSLLHSERRVLTVSRLQTGAVGVDDVALSLPCIVDANGAVQRVELELDELEREALARSAQILHEAIASLGPIS